MPAGRPKKEIDHNLLKKLAEAQCTDLEIAANLGIGINTLHDNFREEIAYARAVGLSLLRLAQWEKAIDKKDTTMLKHLGKIYLGQRDEISLTTEEPSVRLLLNRWEGNGPKINASNVVVKTVTSDKTQEPPQVSLQPSQSQSLG